MDDKENFLNQIMLDLDGEKLDILTDELEEEALLSLYQEQKQLKDSKYGK